MQIISERKWAGEICCPNCLSTLRVDTTDFKYRKGILLRGAQDKVYCVCAVCAAEIDMENIVPIGVINDWVSKHKKANSKT